MQAINWIILLEEIKNLNTDTYKKMKNEKYRAVITSYICNNRTPRVWFLI